MERSPCAVNMAVPSTSLLSDEHSTNDVSSTTDCASPSVRIDSTSGSNKWDKKHACKFCSKLVIKMSDHLARCHRDEVEVVHVLSMKLCSTERKHAWSAMLKEGDYLHNCKVLESGKGGTVIPVYRTKTDKKADDFVPCSVCHGLYHKSPLYLHVQRCGPEHGVSVSRKRKAAIMEGELMWPAVSSVNKGFREKVLMSMKEDDVKKIVLKDPVIMQYGERMFMKKDVQEHTPNYISSRMRIMGKLMQVLQRTTSGPERISTLTEALSAANFVVLLAAVRELCGYDETSHSFNKGSLALKIGYSLKRCNAILKSQAAKTGNSVLKKQAHAFEDVFDADWNDYISSCALQSIESTRRNQPKRLPSCKDVEKLYIYLKGKAAASSDETYADLAQRTLCQITLLNRKRGGEVQRMTIVDYQQGLARQADVDPVILESLDAWTE